MLQPSVKETAPQSVAAQRLTPSGKAITSVPNLRESYGTNHSHSDILPATMDQPQKLQEMLAGLWKQHWPAIEERVEILARACDSIRNGTLTAREREEAQSAAHKLAGVLGTFGRIEGTDFARKIENWLADPENLPAHSTDLNDALTALRNSIN